VSNSITVHPTDQISQAVEICRVYSMISGAIQYGVPARDDYYSSSFYRAATPKSVNFTIPFFVVRIFAPFMSR